MGYQAAEIERYIFLATLDLRTSAVCRKLDMKRFPVAEARAGTNLPPMHPNCRSTTMADMTDEQLRKTSRFARDPKTGKAISVPGDMTYREWYGKYVEGKKNVANTAESTAKATPKAERTPQIAPQDVTSEYLSAATPGVGAIEFDDGYSTSRHKAEMDTAQWIHDNLGGDIKLLNESTVDGQKMPDYMWNGKMWDLKTISSAKAANSAIRHGLKQIREKPGGIILSFRNETISEAELEETINKRMQWYQGKEDIDIMELSAGKLIDIKRYKGK